MYLIVEGREEGDSLARDSEEVLTALKINLEASYALVERASLCNNLICKYLRDRFNDAVLFFDKKYQILSYAISWKERQDWSRIAIFESIIQGS